MSKEKERKAILLISFNSVDYAVNQQSAGM